MTSRLYAIADRGSLPDLNLLVAVQASLEGGAKMVQYRNKSANRQLRLKEALAIKALCSQYKVPLLINDDIELANTVNADGVHLGQSDGSVEQARSSLGDEAIIGVTCHNSLALAIKAEQAGADYVSFGRFFPSQTKPDAPQATIETLQKAKLSLTIPIVAIGGITLENAPTLVDYGADILAVSYSLFGRDDIKSAAQAFCRSELIRDPQLFITNKFAPTA